MKYFLSLSLSILLLLACAPKRPEKRSRLLKGFIAQNNTLFNAKEALKAETDARIAGHKDNFYAPYIQVLDYEDTENISKTNSVMPTMAANNTSAAEENPFGLQQNAASRRAAQNPMPNGAENGAPKSSRPGQPPAKPATPLEIAEDKALKAIDKYSVIREEREKNSTLFDAYTTLIRSRIYQNKNVQALEAINLARKRFKDDKRLPLVDIYEGVAYAKLGDLTRAAQLYQKIGEAKIGKDEAALLAIYQGENFLKQNKKTEAQKQFAKAFDLNSSRKTKSRLAFLQGQILLEDNHPAEAREKFLEAYKYADDFEFEVKSQIQVAKTYSDKNDYSGGKKYLEDISKKGTYASRKNEFLYALGMMASQVGQKQEARDYFGKSLREKASDPQIRGLDYYELGKSYLAQDDYISAGVYYDSAVAAMTYEPTKIQVKKQAESIKKIADNYYLIKKNDSILRLTRMSEAEKTTYFTDYISKLKAREAAQEKALAQEAAAADFNSGDFNANSVFGTSAASAFQDFGTAAKGFYFANASTVARGTSDFRQLWGDRQLADNWRTAARAPRLEDLKSTAMAQQAAANPRRYETAYYLESIPTDEAKISELKNERDKAELMLGTLYQDAFGNTPLATKTLYHLVDNNPEEKIMLQALYQIFAMNYERNPAAAEPAKKRLVTDYPYTSYTAFAQNPAGKTFVKSSPGAETAYKTAYSQYQEGHYDLSQKTLEAAMSQYKTDALMPKFALLNAMNSGKMHGKEVLLLQLEQIVLNYERSAEAERAKEMIETINAGGGAAPKGPTEGNTARPPGVPRQAEVKMQPVEP